MVRQSSPAIKPVDVEVLRNGKSVEEISFVHTNGSAHDPLPAHSSGFGNTAGLRGVNAAGTPSLAGQNGLTNTPGSPDDSPVSSFRPVGSDKSGHVTPLVNSKDGAGLGFTGSRAKTIDVPGG
jgi:hypothetical protein